MSRFARACFVGLLATLLASSADAIDVVVRKGGGQRDGGSVSKMTKTEVTVTKQVGGDSVVPVNEIAWIEWDGAPGAMALGRSALEAGQLDVAQKQLETALTESASSSNANMRGDLTFLRAKVAALRALTDPGQAADASTRLQGFLTGNRDHYRTFEAQLLLGEVALASDDYAAATAAFAAVGAAPWKDFQMAAQVGQGRTYLAQKNVDAARREFDAVASTQPQNPAETSRQLEALLGQAQCLQQQGKHSDAITILDKVIDGATSSDSRLQAEAYVRQGDCYVSLGGNAKEAIMAFLHVDVIPNLSKESDLHAEALYNLARLWNQIGQPDRAREAAETLQGAYPQSEWAKKLAG